MTTHSLLVHYARLAGLSPANAEEYASRAEEIRRLVANGLDFCVAVKLVHELFDELQGHRPMSVEETWISTAIRNDNGGKLQ